MPTGYIYAIRSFNSELIYIGSTIKNVSARYKEHIAEFNRKKSSTRSHIVLEKGDYYIDTIATIEYTDIYDLRFEELMHIHRNSNIVVNRRPTK